MTAIHLSSVALISLALGSGLAVTTVNVVADPMKLNGCLVRAEDDDGYLLINPPVQPGATTTGNGSVAPGSVGTTAAFTNIFYWLDKDDDLKPHVGHRVEIEGDIKGDLKPGEIEIDRKDQWTEIKVKSNGHDMKARVPNSSVVAAPGSDRKLNVLVRRVDVDKVRMLDAICR